MLISKYENPKEKVDKLIEYQNKMTNEGLKSGTYSSISALALMSNNENLKDIQQKIRKAKDIYKEMKSNHFFLTSQSDYPLAILLSKYDKPTSEIIEEIEYYYTELSDGPFKKGNTLQLLSHIMMLSDTENKNFMVKRCNEIYDKLKTQGIKIKRMHYPAIGMMAIIDSELDKEIEFIKNIADIINKQKRFKWTKDLNLLIAMLLVITDSINEVNQDINVIETGLNTSIESLIQAQNAALIASITSTSVVVN
ncbi:conserved protein YeaA [Caldisalinibacter kiritimatiensis]|uniref:Conserved protein YeaA n=2 Tax=Caldisalinibacter kiritimatiensis TaxID=1304284 RepID=R1CA72_9FIRM|nr:conserved protein YeaA [Caldisalinibacter kiritimatiensis]